MESAQDKARVLVEALPYLSTFRGSTVVIKYGGHAMDDPAARAAFARDVVLLKFVGISPVVVHGGGPQIGSLLDRLGIPSRFVAGQRVTDEATMDVVEMVLGGSVNKEIVRQIAAAGGRAVGITGKDGGLVRARKLAALEDKGERVDPGRVGEVEMVDPRVLETLVAEDFIPVIAPVGVDGEGQTLNINADPFAARIAAALHAEKLILLTDVAGLLDGKGGLVHQISAADARAMIGEGVIKGGMIPKIECCIDALADGVRRVHIIDGRVEHAILLEIFTDTGIGTVINR